MLSWVEDKISFITFSEEVFVREMIAKLERTQRTIIAQSHNQTQNPPQVVGAQDFS